MTKKYIAIGSVGHFSPGDEIEGLDADRIQALLASGAIAGAKEPEQPDESGVEVEALTNKVTELESELKNTLAKASQAEAQNIAYVKEIEVLKAEITELKQPKAAADGDAQPATAKSAKAK